MGVVSGVAMGVGNAGGLRYFMQDPAPVSPKGLVVDRRTTSTTDATFACVYDTSRRTFYLRDESFERAFLRLLANKPERIWGLGKVEFPQPFSYTFLNNPGVVKKCQLRYDGEKHIVHGCR
jgi:hypothetical protein